MSNANSATRTLMSSSLTSYKRHVRSLSYRSPMQVTQQKFDDACQEIFSYELTFRARVDNNWNGKILNVPVGDFCSPRPGCGDSTASSSLIATISQSIMNVVSGFNNYHKNQNKYKQYARK
jgi:hypothetical protein